MSPKKLTEATKQEILTLYRETGETTSTLADRYGVSSSTISRFLKACLSESEYEDLIQLKRLARTPKGAYQLQLEMFGKTTPSSQEAIPIPPTKEAPVMKPKGVLVVEEEEEELEEGEEVPTVDVVALGEMLGEDLEDEYEDDLEEDEEDEEEEEITWEKETDVVYLTKTEDIQVLPLSSASFPKTCYIVIDRSAELITRPLKDFAHLGKIPSDEVQQKTLPVFDNHRVARRFSNRSQRVIKVPDGRMLEKTRPYLEAKGITRLLLDGQIYSF